MSIVEKLSCDHCGAPISFEPGEIIATCKYCGFTVVIQTRTAFSFEHSMLLNRYDQTSIVSPIKNWMGSGFLKPPDLERKARLIDKSLTYVPFWIVMIDAETFYKGMFERITPSVVKEGQIRKRYNWLVLARKAAEFPTREYDLPLEGKIPYDFRKIEGFAKVFNSEVDKDEAVERAKQEIEGHHQHLAQQNVDKIIEFKSEMKISQTVYLHAPIWFVKYEYKGRAYQIFVDGASGMVIKGDIPPAKFGIF